MKVPLSELNDIVARALKKFGYTDEEAAIIQDVLMYAQLRDNNQGVVKLIGRGLPKDPAQGEITVVRETPISALLDGQKNQGMVLMTRAVEIVIEKARASGFGIVGTYNTNSSTGAIGYYARKLADAGLIGFVFSGSPPTVTTQGSFQPIFGTNPIAIGMPSDRGPIVYDITTAAMAYYGLVEANAAGRSIPNNVAYDSDGNLTTDPAKALKGAILPFDRGPRGAGLSLMIELLTGPLVMGSFAGLNDPGGNWGNLLYAFSPDLLVDSATFKQQVSQLVDTVKGLKRLPGVEEILVPGERGDRLTQQRLESGMIDIEDRLYAELQQVVAGV